MAHGLAHALEALHEILVTHLEREEDVIPVFLELAPAELWSMFGY